MPGKIWTFSVARTTLVRAWYVLFIFYRPCCLCFVVFVFYCCPCSSWSYYDHRTLRSTGGKDGNGKSPVHSDVLPAGVSGAREPGTARRNLGPQRRGRGNTKLRVHTGHDPGANVGAGASAAAGKSQGRMARYFLF